ncbi:hypothetical protein PEC18_18715 [Paucibacter sp. O1-1]|nr:hypothetical protein [Paucibacter sp. O1-1]MDA3827830.1 hypothetical protein [Paucibacter sp. O1-1]
MSKPKSLRAPGQRFGWRGYLDILRYLQKWPSTADQMAAACCVAEAKGTTVLRHLHAARLAHISGWTKSSSPRANWRPVWSAGHGHDAPRPGHGTRTWARANNLSAQLIALASVLRALVEPITVADLADVTGCNAGTIRLMLRHAKKIGFARISDWVPPASLGGHPAAMWRLGHGDNAPRPAAKTRAEIYAQNWQRRKGRQAMQALIRATAATQPRAMEAQ